MRDLGELIFGGHGFVVNEEVTGRRIAITIAVTKAGEKQSDTVVVPTEQISAADGMTTNLYDRTPYPRHAYGFSHPSRMAAMATLAGLVPPPD